jgi:RNA polymerase sigma-70 factor (ECF subfamily)
MRLRKLSTFRAAGQLLLIDVSSPEFILGMSVFAMEPPADVLARAWRGDEAAFEELMRVHERQVLRTALRLLGRVEDAEDAAQEVFLRLYRNLRGFQTLAEIRPWLYRVTVNVCYDLGRKRRRFVAEFPEELPVQQTQESDVSLEQRRELLAEALAYLPEKERAAVVLREIEGLETAKVAEILGSTPVTVRTQVSTGRARLREIVARLERRKR